MNEPFGEDKAPPALSVVIVAYNSAASLPACVAALAAQTFGDFELLIVDNGSEQPAALDMVRELVTGHEAVARTARSIFPLAEAASDEPTADLLTQRLQIHEKTAWMLRSLLEG